MTSTVPAFGEWLQQAIAEEAAIAGESVDVFVARSVAARLRLERTSRGDARLEEFLAKIAEFGLAAPTPPNSVINDPERLRVLHDTQLLDAESEAAYDRIVEIAAEALAVPAAAVSLVDYNRQFFSSAVGLPPEWAASRQTPLERSICQSIVQAGEPLIVEDARLHPTLKGHLAVLEDSLVAYAGFPLTDPDGHTVGTLCVWDSQPRQWSSGHVQILQDLADLVRRRMFDTQE
jgi:hypothetical protein